VSKTIDYTPHAYALLLPPLTDEEYAGLKADIAEHGILYPVIVDEEGRVLDGVHRVRIASELGVNLPVSRHPGLSDERKLHLAVGLNMRRRHLDSDRRRALVRKLHKDEKLSLRKIASVTGWSKSTIDRDLKASPFETVLSHIGELHDRTVNLKSGAAKEIFLELDEGLHILFGWADAQWKRDNWPPRDEEELLAFRMNLYALGEVMRWTAEAVRAKARDEEVPPEPPNFDKWERRWHKDADFRRRAVEQARKQGLLDRVRVNLSQMGQLLETAVPNGTRR